MKQSRKLPELAGLDTSSQALAFASSSELRGAVRDQPVHRGNDEQPVSGPEASEQACALLVGVRDRGTDICMPHAVSVFYPTGVDAARRRALEDHAIHDKGCRTEGAVPREGPDRREIGHVLRAQR